MKDDDAIFIVMPERGLRIDGNIVSKWYWDSIVKQLRQDAWQNRLNLAHIAEQQKRSK